MKRLPFLYPAINTNNTPKQLKRANYEMKAFAFLCIASLISFSCKKGDSSTSGVGCTLSPTSILGTYKVVGSTIQQTATSPVVDDFATLPPCEKDDQITLNADGTYRRIDIGVLCSSPAEVITGTWSLNGNSFTNDGSPGTVVSFDCHTLVISIDGYPKETGTFVK